MTSAKPALTVEVEDLKKRPETREDQQSHMIKVAQYRRKLYVAKPSPSSRNLNSESV